MKTLLKRVGLLGMLVSSFVSHSALVTYSGVDFPAGDVSFVDEIISYTPGPDVAINSIYDVPENLIGAPDGAGVSIGDGGEIVMRFIDNVLFADGTAQEDIWIFEIGPAVEWFFIDISVNGSSWIEIGNVRGQPSGIDIDAVAGINLDDEFSWVRLRDDETRNNSGFPFGEGDFDAIGAISSRNPPPPIPSVSAPASTIGFLAITAVGLVFRRFRF